MKSKLIVALAIVAAGCGAKSASPTAPAPTASSLQIVADQKTFDVGTDQRLRAIAVMSDGSTLTLTNGLTWRTSDNAILDVADDGVVTAMSTGEAAIMLTWNGLTASTTFRSQQTRSGVFVRGRVRDYSTNLPMSGFLVRYSSQAVATTDSSGMYSLWVPATGEYLVQDGTKTNNVVVTSTGVRGDLLIDRGTCIARYGQIVDSATFQPIVGATVSLYGGLTAITDGEGAYRFDRGCPASGIEGFNTNILSVTKAGYATNGRVQGRGLYFVVRVDLALNRQ